MTPTASIILKISIFPFSQITQSEGKGNQLSPHYPNTSSSAWVWGLYKASASTFSISKFKWSFRFLNEFDQGKETFNLAWATMKKNVENNLEGINNHTLMLWEEGNKKHAKRKQ